MTQHYPTFSNQDIVVIEKHFNIGAFQVSHSARVETNNLRVLCKQGLKEGIITGLATIIEREGLQHSNIGGLSVCIDKGWWRVKVDPNEAALIARCSSDCSLGCKELVEHLRCKFLTFGLKLPTSIEELWG